MLQWHQLQEQVFNRFFRTHHTVPEDTPEFRVELSVPTLRLGSEYGGWRIDPRDLTSASTVYSFGIGDDISFDLGLIERFGCEVHAFDPTPKAIAWVKSQVAPPTLHVYEYGLADHDGTIEVFPPSNPEHVSHSPVRRGNSGAAPIQFQVLTLKTIMSRLGHTSIDLLKMDIEGAEYEAVANILHDRIPIRQLLVECHHRFPEIGLSRTLDLLSQVRAHGFRLAAVSASEEEFSFLKL